MIFTVREHSKVTSSKIRCVQTPSYRPSSSARPPPPLDDAIFHRPPFPKIIFGKIVFYGKIAQDSTLIQIYECN